ncbi:ABC transporter permease [Candidatus Woesearchaeota archaeon]|nr:ABC transporter permease [Candidatus Woesearchaeota archaeon]
MRVKKSFKLALNILMHSKLRSWLTIIGIVIGIAAVVSIVSISEGAKASLEERLGSLGADVITVNPGFSRASGAAGGFHGIRDLGERSAQTSSKKNLTSKDVITLRSTPNVKFVMGEISGRADLAYSSKKSSANIKGIDSPIWKEITTEKLKSGRLLMQGDSYSVVIGGNLASKVFEKGIPLNSKVDIAGKLFKVVGVLEEGSTVYMPINIARETLGNTGNNFNSISLKIADVSLSDETVADITKKLTASRGILKETDQDFTVSSPKAMQETMQQTLGLMSLFLGAIAAISLIVGAIGIANTMFTSVLEKTKEIGIMKAIGGKNRDILIIFLANSGLIGLVGGIGGVILGVFGSGLISYYGSAMSSGGMGGGGIGRMFSSTAITPTLLIFALTFSLIIGMVAGVIPAYRASKLKPVDALRYE